MMINRAQLARLASIDFHLYYWGHVSRKEHAGRFGLEGAQATRDLTLYRDFIEPGRVVFDDRLKRYRATDSFEPVYNHPSKDIIQRIVSSQDSTQLHEVLSALLGVPDYDYK
ncbi:hypothetical protein D3C75_995280 [compost metagenome]